MFQLFKSKNKLNSKEDNVILSPIEGEAIGIKNVKDPMFANELLGKSVAIIPHKGRVVAPVDGKINVMYESKHAIGITSKSGSEILIHIGLETVNLKGKFFKAFVNVNDAVKAGDLLVEFDLDEIKKAGYDTTTMIIVCNSANYAAVQTSEEKFVAETDEIMKLVS